MELRACAGKLYLIFTYYSCFILWGGVPVLVLLYYVRHIALVNLYSLAIDNCVDHTTTTTRKL